MNLDLFSSHDSKNDFEKYIYDIRVLQYCAEKSCRWQSEGQSGKAAWQSAEAKRLMAERFAQPPGQPRSAIALPSSAFALPLVFG